MKRFVEGLGREQSTLFPSSLDDYVSEDNPVRVVDAFVDSVNLEKLGLLGLPLLVAAPFLLPSLGARGSQILIRPDVVCDRKTVS